MYEEIEEKGQALFAEFERLMKTDRIYRERDITIDKVADRLGTNRSYLSRAINENGGMSFSQYINSRRIGEAVMDELKLLDEVAYVRFASVYRQFTDVSSFMDELNKLLTEGKKGDE